MYLSFILTILSFNAFIDCKREPKFAPYIDVTHLNDFKLVEFKENYGIKAFSLAFAAGGFDGSCTPTWGAITPISNATIINEVKAFQRAGGDVIVSTGGAMSPYLELVCQSTEQLANAYKQVLDVTGSKHLDIDIESTVDFDHMNEALATLQKNDPDITVSFTLMVGGDDYGINDPLGVKLLENAVKHGVDVDVVNIMAMNFWTKLSDWGEACIGAGESTILQMKKIWPQKSEQELYSMLGVTAMIGLNNSPPKVFDRNAAKLLVNWAKRRHIGHLGFWSMGRDRPCPGQGLSPVCSSIEQSEYEFTKIFLEFEDNVDPITDTTLETDGTTATTPVETTERPTEETTHWGDRTTQTHSLDCSIPNKHYPYPKDCTKFYWCVDGQPQVEECPVGTIYDIKSEICNFPQDVDRPECHKRR